MAGWYEIKKSEKNGQYSFVLKADNGEIILTSEQYVAKSSAENGIESVRTNSPNDARYERLTSTNDKPYFNLKATNGQVIGTSQLYSSTSSRDSGIESVKTNGPTKIVKDNT
ncbi:YegP family protein [Methylobacillus flagellatus]|uniref:YegP family protein n=1 Tax=Methylobacillus flagellatus TaxID=405 RepID=UPI002853F4D3|nr:YegP family protein [Methylobacillus flagellatus]MDR5171134.1 YegP family protein [Methylobacillus flagellatus]